VKVSYHLVGYDDCEILMGNLKKVIDRLHKFHFGLFPAWRMSSVSFGTRDAGRRKRRLRYLKCFHTLLSVYDAKAEKTPKKLRESS
jgi:hypothetical protein